MKLFRHLGAASAIALSLIASGGGAAAKDQIVAAIQLEPPHLDPTSAAAQAIDSVLYNNVFEGLTKIDASGAVKPALAESWDISADELTYRFKLRADAQFHDGSSFDASDVKFSLDRARGEKSVNAQKALFASIAEVNVIDPTTVEIKLSAPNGALLFNLAWGDAVIVAPESIADIKTKPIGTGPYKFDRWVKGDRLEMSVFDGYWGEKPAISKATFRFISDPTAAFAAVRGGGIDLFAGYPAPENLDLFRADSRFQVLVGNTEGETILAMNNAAKPFDDVRVRKAVALAIDRNAIIQGAMYGVGTPIGSHFAPHHPDYIDLTGLSPHDPAEAKRLLAEAGYPNGFKTTLKLPPPSYARRGGEIIASQLRAIGIEAQISNLQWAQWLEEVFRGKNFGLTIVSHTEPMDIGIYARENYYFQYKNPAFNAVMQKLTAAGDPAMRSTLMKQAQRILAEDYVNGFLFELAFPSVAKKELKGVWLNQPTAAVVISDLSWSK